MAMQTKLSIRGFWTAASVAAISASALAVSHVAKASMPGAEPAPAATIRLTSDAFPGKTYLLKIFENDQGAIQSMTEETDAGKPLLFSLSDLKAGKPVYDSEGEKITLSLDADFTPQKGGHLELRFITNVFSGAFKNFRILADVQGDAVVLRSDPDLNDPNSDQNSYSGVFDSLYFKKGWVGVSKVEPSEN